MNTRVLAFALAIAATHAQAQNIQYHYDLGHSLYTDDLTERPSSTTTVELFKPDRWGNTFFFIDLDYYSNGVGGAYWEIAREFNLGQDSRWAAHAEYDGGLSNSKHLNLSTRFQQALLLGPAWNWHSTDFRRTFSVQALYKYYFKGEYAAQRPFSSFQLTEVWGISFAGGRFTFSGYCDLWYDDSVDGNLVLQSEPQLWFNLNALRGCKDINLSVGTEVELSNNFIYTDTGQHNRAFAIPTLALKWTF